MTSATRRMKIPFSETEHSEVTVLSGQAASQKIPMMLLIDVLDCGRHAADEMSPELLEHVCGCEACLAASIGGACGSPFCHQRPDAHGRSSRI